MAYNHASTSKDLEVLARVVEEITGERPDMLRLADAASRHMTGRRLLLALGPLKRWVHREHHQRLIDDAARLRCVGHGFHGPILLRYSEVYSAYVRSAKAAGLAPLSLKTFANRALVTFPRRPHGPSQR